VPSAPAPSPLAIPAGQPRCYVTKCGAAATHAPVLCVALLGHTHVSRVVLPTHVCSGHRESFANHFLTPARREQMAASLLSHGRGGPDWARTHVEFVHDL
jgi:hypothetical protein